MSVLGGVGLQGSTHAVLLGASALAGSALLGTALRHRSERIARPIALLAAVVVAWALADAARLLVTSEPAMRQWLLVRAVVGSFVGVLQLWLVLEYLDRRNRRTSRLLALLFAVPATTAVLVVTGVRPDLVLADASVVELTDPLAGTTYTWLEASYGPWFTLNAVYDYVLILAGYALLLGSLAGGSATVHREQTAAFLLAGLPPLAVNVALQLGVLSVDLTAASFVVGLAVVSAAVFRYDVFRLLPIARDTAVENVEVGFLVLDREDRVVDVNPAAVEMLAASRSALLDVPASEVVPEFDDVVADVPRTDEFSTQLGRRAGSETRYFDLDGSPILDGRDRAVGRVLLLEDVSERVQRKQRLQERSASLARRTEELERQNERLEEFAGVLSHDLRNPLNVATSYLQCARETGDPDDFDAVEESLDRIERLVDDLLTMARQGRTVDDPSPVALSSLARRAWEHVDTDGARLVVATDAEVRADDGRLLQVFENLFRNAVEHGLAPSGTDGRGPLDGAFDGSSGAPADAAERAIRDGGEATVPGRDADASRLTVRVGDLEDGFYVADDGPGIPPERREAVFERGFTTEPEGTGLGLAIVRTAVDAHGWTVAASESRERGARFEVRGVRPAEDA